MVRMRRKIQQATQEPYEARDIDQAVKGAYPPELVGFASACSVNVPTQVLGATPPGVWRVVRHFAIILSSANVNGAWLAVGRGGTVYPIQGATAWATTYISTLTTPITLRPGDSLYIGVNVGGPTTVTGGIGYVDVPIPGGGMAAFKPGKRG